MFTILSGIHISPVLTVKLSYSVVLGSLFLGTICRGMMQLSESNSLDIGSLDSTFLHEMFLAQLR